MAEISIKHIPKDKAAGPATVLSDGRFMHDFPIIVETVHPFELPISAGMPPTICELMDLYPQAGSRRPRRAAVLDRPRTQP